MLTFTIDTLCKRIAILENICAKTNVVSELIWNERGIPGFDIWQISKFPKVCPWVVSQRQNTDVIYLT